MEQSNILTNRKEVLLYLKSKEQGNIADLVKKVAPELIESFVVLGFIRKGPKIWYLTAKGKKQCNFYREPTEEEAKRGCILDNLGI